MGEWMDCCVRRSVILSYYLYAAKKTIKFAPKRVQIVLFPEAHATACVAAMHSAEEFAQKSCSNTIPFVI